MSTKEFSSKQESMVADYLGWKTVVGSGARDFHYGDVIELQWLGECKTHMKQKMKITFYQDHWDKIVLESLFHHRNPVLIVDNGTQKLENTYCMFKYEFDSMDMDSIIRVDYIKRNLNLILDDLNKTSVYKIVGFDKRNDVYICSIERFKEFLEEG